MRGGREQRDALLRAAEELAQVTGMTAACQILNIPRSSVYRARKSEQSPESVRSASSQRSKAARALSAEEKEAIKAAYLKAIESINE